MIKVLRRISLLFLVLTTFSSFAQNYTDVGSENLDEEFETWCNRRLQNLDYARAAAARKVLQGKYSEAAYILIDGLNMPSDKKFNRAGSVTINLMSHAQSVGRSIMGVSGADVRGAKASVVTLEAFYDLIKNTAYKIDLPYYRRDCGYCNYRQTISFERDVLEMVSNMLSLVNNHLIYSRDGQKFPLGPTAIYLNASQIVTTAGYNEIRTLLYADAYSCEILDLKDISRRLIAFNGQSTTEYEKKDMLFDTYYAINGVIQKISGDYSCRRY